MKKTEISPGGGKIHEWVTSVTVRDKNLAEAIRGILGASDFHARLSDFRYSNWLRRVSINCDESAVVSSVLKEEISRSEISSRIPAFLGDCAGHGLQVSGAAFVFLRQLKMRESAKFICAILIAAPDFWFDDIFQAQGIFMRTCVAILDSPENVKNLTSLVLRILKIHRPEILGIGRELFRVLLPLASLPFAAELLPEVPISETDPKLVEALVTDNDRLRIETACLVGDGAASHSILTSLQPFTPAYAACLVRFALSQKSENIWRVISYLNRAVEESAEWGICAVRFAAVFGPETDHVVKWLIEEDAVRASEVFKFWAAQLGELRGNVTVLTHNHSLMRQLVKQRGRLIPEPLLALLEEVSEDDPSSPEYSDA